MHNIVFVTFDREKKKEHHEKKSYGLGRIYVDHARYKYNGSGVSAINTVFDTIQIKHNVKNSNKMVSKVRKFYRFIVSRS